LSYFTGESGKGLKSYAAWLSIRMRLTKRNIIAAFVVKKDGFVVLVFQLL
jgi:hypothetical protein